jgi:uncharacterized protein YukE
MLELLKEMGKVCQNRRMGEFLVNFHRQRFNELYLWNGEQADAHQKQWAFWSKRVTDMNKHIKQLHERLKGAA